MRRRGTLKRRFEVVLGTTTAVLLVVLAAAMVSVRYRDQKRLLENNALMFAQTTNSPVCQQYQIYYHSGSYKFREIVRRTMALNPDVRRILLVSVLGEVLYDSEESPNYNLEPSHPVRRLEDPKLVSAAAELAPSEFHVADRRGGRLLLIVAPYMEEWGRHPYSVVYVFSYGSLTSTLRAMIFPIGGLLLLSLIVAAAVARSLAGRVARPIELLTEGVRKFDAGRYRDPLHLSTSDEIEDLAESFNRMAVRLDEHVEQLESANEELKTLDRLKTDLLANVSHELRTPLSAVRGYVEFMSDGNLGSVNDQQARALDVCLRNIDRLNRNINMLLDFSRFELGHVSIQPAPFRLDQLARQVVAAFEAEAHKKSIDLQVQSPDNVIPVMGDRERITQVIENLLSNALKFTPRSGKIVVRVEPVPAEHRVELGVADEGIGIAPEDREKIFNKFFQIEGGASRRFGGVGLGLAIVKSILDAHRAAILVEERSGPGTEFRFSLPEAASGSPRETPPYVTTPEASVRRRIVAIDDDPDFLAYLSDSLSSEGRTLLPARSAQEGIELARTTNPSLVLLDIHLPDRDGFQVLEALKADPATREVPVLILTVVNEKTEGFRLGAEEYLVKPVDRSSLLDAVARALGRTARAGPAEILVVDDEPDVLAALAGALSSKGYAVRTASSGGEALQTAAASPPSLIVLDVMMPEMTGWEVLRRLRESSLHDVPVIVLSARQSPADIAEGYELGARCYVGKAGGYDRLLDQIRSLVGPAYPESAA